MMSETAIKSAVCDACGADVRDESLFCYNCGERVTAEAPGTTKADETIEVVSRPPLKSAATLRKQRRAFNRQPVEVVWEQRTGPATGFVITTIVLVIAALVLLLIALYLR
jgi:hypothetical protein